MPSNPLWPRRLNVPMYGFLMCLCLLLLLTGCAQQPVAVMVPPAPLPADLARECDEGPAIPVGDTTLGALLDLMAQREAAAADCRSRHRRTVEAWPR